MVRPERVVEWDVLPVVEKVAMEAKATPAVVAYAQVAFSFVVTESVVCVVPDARLPEGAVMVTAGGVVSTAACVVADAEDDCALVFPAASYAETVYA